MKLKDFYYDLPQELIAQHPMKERSSSKLLVLDRKTGGIEHKRFYNIIEYLEKGDCLVLNNTKVIPARLLGVKEDTKGKIEMVLIKKISQDSWEVILKPGKRAKPGARFVFGDGILTAEILEIVDDGNRIVKFEFDGSFEETLDKVGVMPLPPYITEKLKDPQQYQTVYSKINGSAAAPTAGLHFTEELLSKIENKGVKVVYVTLHVGLGTFRPVKEDEIEKHKMHSEYYILDEGSCSIINQTVKEGGRVVAVGTTSCRVLETLSDENGVIKPGNGWTDIFIYPGYKFKIVNEIITNFHLPESTLLMLVSAFAGRDNTMAAYKEAIKEGYRFYSFGDAMYITTRSRMGRI
jgi:S-adenosylmethionine:tRNA ribosyltransferase-isomerase